MLKHLTRTAAAGVLAFSMIAVPAAEARTYQHSRYYYAHHHRGHHHYRQCRRAGSAAGIVSGALIGNAVTHHSTLGTIVGAGVGGAAGHEIARNRCSRR